MSRNIRARSRHALPLLVAVALSLTPAGGEQEPADDGIFFETVDVNLVNVDVFVTDDKGEPVTGLGIDDFELLEDGRPVEITNFYAVENREYRRAVTAPATPSEAEPPESEPSAPAFEEIAEIPSSQKLSVVLFIDNLNLRPFNRNKVMGELKRFLHDNLTPADQVMVVSFQRTVKVQQPFTTDLLAVSQALAEMERDAGLRAPAETERRDVIRSIEMARDHQSALAHVELYASSVFHDMTTSLRAMQDLVGSLGGLEGRKALVHVSDGLPMTAADDLFQLLDQIWPDTAFSGKIIASRFSARRSFRELAARANSSRVTFYTLDASGLRSHSSLSAEYGGKGGNLGRLASLAEIDFARFSNETEPLQMMALDTGGQAIFNTNNFDELLDRVGQDFNTFYSLGYLSRYLVDGRYHSIEVKVKRKGVDVRHREGFRARTAETVVNDATYASLLFNQVRNELGIQVGFEQPTLRDDGQFLTPVLVRIPIGNIVLVPQETLHRGTLRVSVAVIDREGQLSPINQQQVPVEIPEDDLENARQSYYVYSAELLMREGEQTVAVGVRDDLSGESSFVRAAVDLGT